MHNGSSTALSRFSLLVMPPRHTLSAVGPSWLLSHINRNSLWIVAAVLFTEAVYIFIASAGRFSLPWPTYMSFYDQQADAFRAGQLHLLVTPAPQVLAAADPHSLTIARHWYIDASYYQGKYFTYWGPVPALLQAAAKALLHIDRNLGDQYLVFAFSSCSLVAGTVLLVRMRQRLCRAVPPWVVPTGIVAFGLANPTLFLISSGGVYQAAIAGAQAFLFLGLAWAFDAVWEQEATKKRQSKLIAAGVALALAVGCRVSVSLAVAPLVLLTLACTFLSGHQRISGFIKDALRMGLPIGLGAFLLLLYNQLRFNNWFDFGIDKQLSHFPFRRATEYLLPNLDSYLSRLPELRCKFPFVYATSIHGAGVWFAQHTLPKGYLVHEPVVGLLWVVPMVYAIPAALIAALSRLGRGLLTPMRAVMAAHYHRRRVFVWFVGSLGILVVAPAIAPLGIFSATMRYLADFTNALVLMGILGLWILLETSRRWRMAPRRCAATTVMLSVLTALCGVQLGYHGYTGHFKTFNPELHHQIESSLFFCNKDVPDFDWTRH
jgi:hypothetical protein